MKKIILLLLSVFISLPAYSEVMITDPSFILSILRDRLKTVHGNHTATLHPPSEPDSLETLPDSLLGGIEQNSKVVTRDILVSSALKPGNYIEFRVSLGTSSATGRIGRITVTDEIRSLNGHRVIKASLSGGELNGSSAYYRLSDGAIVRIHLPNIEGVRNINMDFSPPLNGLRSMSVTASLSASGFPTESVSLSQTVSSRGSESVTVPAGTYATTKYYIYVSGSTLGDYISETGYSWVNDHIGAVKSVSDSVYSVLVSTNIRVPVPPDIHSPTGNVDHYRSTTIEGWVYDPDSHTSPIAVHIYADGALIGGTTANIERSDLAQLGLSSNRHGFRYTLPDSLPNGEHLIEVYAINIGSGNNKKMGSGSVTINRPPADTHSPKGNIDEITPTLVRGWAYDPDDQRRSIPVHIYVDGNVAGGITADNSRPDLSSVGLTFANHGFSYTFTDGFLAELSVGEHRVEIFAINHGAGENKRIGSGTFTIDRSPTGNLERVSATQTCGWVYDPSNQSTAISLHVYVNDIFYGTYLANERRSDLSTIGLTHINHGFCFNLSSISSAELTSGSHTIKVYAINIGDGVNRLLGSGQVALSGTRLLDISAPPLSINHAQYTNGYLNLFFNSEMGGVTKKYHASMRGDFSGSTPTFTLLTIEEIQSTEELSGFYADSILTVPIVEVKSKSGTQNYQIKLTLLPESSSMNTGLMIFQLSDIRQ
jgi:hypothetical protein